MRKSDTFTADGSKSAFECSAFLARKLTRCCDHTLSVAPWNFHDYGEMILSTWVLGKLFESDCRYGPARYTSQGGMLISLLHLAFKYQLDLAKLIMRYTWASLSSQRLILCMTDFFCGLKYWCFDCCVSVDWGRGLTEAGCFCVDAC